MLYKFSIDSHHVRSSEFGCTLHSYKKKINDQETDNWNLYVEANIIGRNLLLQRHRWIRMTASTKSMNKQLRLNKRFLQNYSQLKIPKTTHTKS